MGKQTLESEVIREVKPSEVDLCQHNQVTEIGEDFDEEGRLLRLIRCKQCGLLMREYLPSM